MEKETFFPFTSFFSSHTGYYFIDGTRSNASCWPWNSLVPGQVLSLTNPSDVVQNMENPIGNPQKKVEADEEYEVSTELTLSCGFPVRTKKQKTEKNSLSKPFLYSSSGSTKVSTGLKLSDETWIINNHNKEPTWTKELILLKERDGVGCGSTSNKETDPWIIRKRIVESDISTRCRLVVPTYMVKQYIFPILSEAAIEEVAKSGRGFEVWDSDTKTKHSLVLKQRFNSNCTSYIFIGGWKQNFVNRRSLKEGDEVGFCWNNYYSSLNFSVLNRNPANHQ